MTDLEIRSAIARYLLAQKSPLADYAAYMWIMGRWHGIDGRLVVGIAGAETQFGLTGDDASPPDTYHNAWGYGHPPGAKHGYKFPSWPDGIAAVTDWLRKRYVYNGLDTIEKICDVWVGSHEPHWISTVSSVVDRLGGNSKQSMKVTPLMRSLK